jgi:hypothetical protein
MTAVFIITCRAGPLSSGMAMIRITVCQADGGDFSA